MLTFPPFADVSKTSVERLSSLASQASQGAQQLAALNLQATQATLAELVAHAQAVLAAKSPAEVGQLQAAALRSAPQKAISYGRQVKEIVAAATSGQRTAVEAQVADVQAKFLEAVQGALKNAPGSENTVALVKSAVAAANNAFEGVNKASKQVSDALEANVTKLAQDAVNTSGTTAATAATADA